MSTILAYFGPGQPLYLIFFAAMVVFFTFFYTYNVSFKTDEVAENLKMAAYTLEESEAKDRLEAVLSMFPILGERMKQKAKTMSGGERRMLAITMWNTK